MAKSERLQGYEVVYDWPEGHQRRGAPGYTGPTTAHVIGRTWEIACGHARAAIAVRELELGEGLIEMGDDGQVLRFVWDGSGWQRVIA